MKVRLKVTSEHGVHKVSVVGPDGFEAELEGMRKCRLEVEGGEAPALTAEFIYFDQDIKAIK